MTDNARPFRFEDLNGKPEPESWGPRYSKPQKLGKVRHVEPPSNCASGQPFEFSAAKHRAKLKAEFVALCNAEKRKWATSSAIAEAYEACKKRGKPHYVLRSGEWQLAV